MIIHQTAALALPSQLPQSLKTKKRRERRISFQEKIQGSMRKEEGELEQRRGSRRLKENLSKV